MVEAQGVLLLAMLLFGGALGLAWDVASIGRPRGRHPWWLAAADLTFWVVAALLGLLVVGTVGAQVARVAALGALVVGVLLWRWRASRPVRRQVNRWRRLLAQTWLASSQAVAAAGRSLAGRVRHSLFAVHWPRRR